MKDRLLAEDAADKHLAEAMERPDDLAGLKKAVEAAIAIDLDSDRCEHTAPAWLLVPLLLETPMPVPTAVPSLSPACCSRPSCTAGWRRPRSC